MKNTIMNAVTSASVIDALRILLCVIFSLALIVAGQALPF